jgi:hypothetical protein
MCHLSLIFLLKQNAEINDVAGETSTSPIQPTKVCRISAAIVFEFNILMKGVACAIYTIIMDR